MNNENEKRVEELEKRVEEDIKEKEEMEVQIEIKE